MVVVVVVVVIHIAITNVTKTYVMSYFCLKQLNRYVKSDKYTISQNKNNVTIRCIF